MLAGNCYPSSSKTSLKNLESHEALQSGKQKLDLWRAAHASLYFYLPLHECETTPILYINIIAVRFAVKSHEHPKQLPLCPPIPSLLKEDLPTQEEGSELSLRSPLPFPRRVCYRWPRYRRLAAALRQLTNAPSAGRAIELPGPLAARLPEWTGRQKVVLGPVVAALLRRE